MHPAQQQGAAAGWAAAIVAHHGGHGRVVGAGLVLAARESAAEWCADNDFSATNGSSAAAYVQAFVESYDTWYAGQTVAADDPSAGFLQLPEGGNARR